VELVHAYSLVHDDLPAMDDDDLRRGQPTVHRKFDEALAILAGDAMQALAFYALTHDADAGLDPRQRLKMVELLADASGSRGMAGGQAIDLQSTGKQISVAELEAMHIHKTGALIRASVLMACYAGAPLASEHLNALDQYGKALGLAFQIQDDILDVEGSTSTLGKRAGADANRVKPTYPSVMGLENSRIEALARRDRATGALAPWKERFAHLSEFATFLVSRAS